MALQELLSQESVAKFITEHYTKLPYAQTGGCRHLTALGNWATLERLLSQPNVNVLAGAAGQQYEGELPRTLAEAQSLLRDGYTLGIRQAQRHDDGLARLAEDFYQDFRAPIDIHLYFTPAGHAGFGWHYDAEEVFILQTQGSKEWSLRKNTVNPWPLVETLPANMRYERELMPMQRCLLQAGDWLYIPNGYWHSTQAGEASISLSVGIRAPVALDLYAFLRTRLLESLRWRQRLPIRGRASPYSEKELLCRYRELIAELGEDLNRFLSDETFVREFLANPTD